MTLVESIVETKKGSIKAYNSLVLKINGYITNRYPMSVEDTEDIISAVIERVIVSNVESLCNPVAAIHRFIEMEIKCMQQRTKEEALSLELSYEFEDEAIKEVEIEQLKVLFKDILDTLKENESEALRLMFFDDCKLSEISEQMHISKDRARGLIEKSLRQMRHPSRSRIVRGYVYDFD